jgi:hypothetical protein
MISELILIAVRNGTDLGDYQGRAFRSFGVGAFRFAILIIAPNKITEGLPTTINIIHREVNGSAEESAYAIRDVGRRLCGVMRRRLCGYDLVFETGGHSDELHPL